MAELTIRLTIDPDTGKKNITVAYESDVDAMPLEHEDEHRRLMNQLIEGGVLTAAELGTVTIEREHKPPHAVDSTSSRSLTRRRSVAQDT